MNEFILDPRLAADTHWVADLPLSQLRRMDDTRFPWLVLVPRVAGAVEWVDLPDATQVLLLGEINIASRLLRAQGASHKLNIGALGNIVRQLHVHVVSRLEGDAAWPGPVWGQGQAEKFNATALQAEVGALRTNLAAAR